MFSTLSWLRFEADPKMGDHLRISFGVSAKDAILWIALLVPLCGTLHSQSSSLNSTVYPIPANASSIVTGPDGALWFIEGGVTKLGRITTAGVVTEFPLPCTPGCFYAQNNLIVGPDGAFWYTAVQQIGRVTVNGVATVYSIKATGEWMTTGSDGALWFTETTQSGGPSWVGRITTSGSLTEYPLPGAPLPIGGITSGPDGALWFIDFQNNSIGRMSTAGTLTEYPVTNLFEGVYSPNIVTGPDGALWFSGGQFVGRITTAGVVTEYATGGPVPYVITNGPDGALWFTMNTTNQNQIGRITTSGALTYYSLPIQVSGSKGITLGPDGALWICGTPASGTSLVRVVVPGRSGVLSHLAAGGGWETVISLVNTSQTAVPVTLNFYADGGTPLNLSVSMTQKGITQVSAGTFVNATIPPNGTVFVDTGTQPASTVTGWVDVLSSGSVAGFAIFRQTPQTGSPSEGTVPLQTQFPSTMTLPYDNTSGFVMGVAMANLSTTTANITATIWDDSGNQLGTQNLSITPSGHMAFNLATQLALTAGKRGIVHFQSSGGIAGLGLRFSPFGTFTSVPTITP